MRLLVFSLLLAFAGTAAAQEMTPYQEEVLRLQDRYNKLEMDRHDYRKPKPGLPPEQEAERRKLKTELMEKAPLLALMEQLSEDITVLAQSKPVPEEDVRLMDTLKELLACAAPFQEYAKTQEEAKTLAAKVHLLIVRRDAKGLLALDKEMRPK